MSTVVSPAVIKAANDELRKLSTSPSSRGPYAKVSSEQQAKIARYASMQGNVSAARRFSKELGIVVKESSVRVWKGKYLAEIARKQETDETGDISVTKLPSKKRGRPLLLGEKLDTEVKCYIQAVREGGGVVTSTITMAAATAIARKHDRTLLEENGGTVIITKTWAKSLLRRMGFVKRRGSSTAKMTVENFEAKKEQFLLDITAIVEMEEIPPQLVFNWDQTGISIVPGSSWTMELKGSKRVEIVGISDKRQITAVLCGTMAGNLLPLQLIYQGKTSACLPRIDFPAGWHVTCTPNHWSNEEKMKDYLQLIIIPYVERKRKELKLAADQPALAIFDVFKAQQTEDILTLLEEHNIHVVSVPANCTDRLQPMDLSVNKSVKEFMRSKFKEWYAAQVSKQLDEGANIAPVDLKLSTLKPLGAQWLISMYDYLNEHNSIIVNGFKAAGIL